MTDYTGPERRAHGQRRTYQAGCRCLPCKAAEAVYRRHLRGQHARGLPVLGATVSATMAWRRIRQLRCEGLKNAEIARRLGLKRPILEWHPERIRMKSALRLHRLIRELMLEGDDLPLNSLNLPHDGTRR